MKKNIIQEVLKFPGSKKPTLNNYVLSNANHQGFTYISSWPNWHSKIIIIQGQQGSGKSFLSKIWQNSSKALELDLFQSNQETLDNILNTKQNFLLDDFDKYFSQKHKLRNLDNHNFTNFSLTINEIINSCIENNGFMILTCSKDPKSLNFKLADLQSRILSFPVFTLNPPDETTISTFLVNKFSELQLNMSIDLVRYVSARIERSFSKANEFAEDLDKLAITTKKQPNLLMIKQLLNTKNLLE